MCDIKVKRAKSMYKMLDIFFGTSIHSKNNHVHCMYSFFCVLAHCAGYREMRQGYNDSQHSHA